MRFTLRTAIVATLLAGAFVGINVMPREGRKLEGFDVPPDSSPPYIDTATGRGWPLMFEEWYDPSLAPNQEYRWNWPALFVNIVVAFVLTVAALVLVVDRPWRKRTG